MNKQKTRDLLRQFLFFCVRCSVPRLKGLLLKHLPVLSWLPKYKVKENLLCDVISGVSAGTIQVPQGQSIVYSQITLYNSLWLMLAGGVDNSFCVIFYYLFDSFFSFQAWLLLSLQIFLLSMVSIPLSSPSSHISSWALLTRWSQVNQNDLSTAILCDDSDKLPELHGAALSLTLPALQYGKENRCDTLLSMSRYFCCSQHYGGNRVS